MAAIAYPMALLIASNGGKSTMPRSIMELLFAAVIIGVFIFPYTLALVLFGFTIVSSFARRFSRNIRD